LAWIEANLLGTTCDQISARGHWTAGRKLSKAISHPKRQKVVPI